MALGTEIALIKALGGSAGGALPPITAADNGKVLTANSGVWGAQEPIGKKFIVTLTPTAEDYSGTMDKTVAEIDAAYEAGQEIVFMIDNGYEGFSFTVTQIEKGIDEYPRFHAFCIFTELLIEAYNEYTDSEHGTSTKYSTAIYTLTPAT